MKRDKVPTPWRVGEYSDAGGYDCMTGGYRILDADGREVCTIDCADYGQALCEENEDARTKAGVVARLIVEGVNELMAKKPPGGER